MRDLASAQPPCPISHQSETDLLHDAKTPLQMRFWTTKQPNERQMAECLVFQVILLREGLALFIQYEPVGSGSGGGGGSMFLFAGTGQEPRCAVGDVATSLMRHPRYAGCKLLGSMRRDRVDEAWALCRTYVEDERHKHACVTDWCVAAAAMLEERRVVVAKKWWLLPQRAESP